MCSRFLANLLRKKHEEEWRQTQGPLVRCLTTFDLTMIGFGSVVGSGVYVVTGHLARNIAGPAIVLAFFMASVAALLSGLCYAEFSSRIPKAGSSYAYTYIALGEIWAFIVGWNIILEYFIIAAVLARSCSAVINSLSNGKIVDFFLTHLGRMQISGFIEYPDLLAGLLVIFCTFIVCLGVRQSVKVVTITSLINIAVIIFIIIAGTYYSIGSNTWSSPKKFFPYGASGVLAAGAGAFYCFIGVDQITTASEETIDPYRTLPRAIQLSMFVGFIAYFAVSTVLTLMIPFYELSRSAPLAEAFSTLGFKAGKYVVICGALAAMLSSLLSTLFGAPRIIYSMATDGLLFKFFAIIFEKTKIPIVAALTSGFFVSLLTVFLSIQQLLEMLSIGTLTAYTLLAVSVVVSRYDPHVKSVFPSPEISSISTGIESRQWWKKLFVNCCSLCSESVQKNGYKQILRETPSSYSGRLEKTSDILETSNASEESALIARVAIACTTAALAGILVTLSKCMKFVEQKEPWTIVVLCLCSVLVLFSQIVLCRQPKNRATFPYMVPCVPLLPVFSIAVNLLLIVNLSYWSYIRFIIWLAVGKYL